MDINKAVNVFTKTLMWKITEGHPVDQEEIDALNAMRENAGMKPLAISVPAQSGQPAAAPAQEKKAPPKAERKIPGQPKPAEDAPEFNPQALIINGKQYEGQLLPDNAMWTNRFDIRSESSNRLYRIAQNKNKRYWACSCPGWISRRKCKHLTAMGLPWNEEPFEAQLKAASKTAVSKEKKLLQDAARIILRAKLDNAVGVYWTDNGLMGVHTEHPDAAKIVAQAIAKGMKPQAAHAGMKDTELVQCLSCGEQLQDMNDEDYFDEEKDAAAHKHAAELIHSDAELSKMMEPVSVTDGVTGLAHIDGPEAGPSNDEMHANQHEENGVPVTDGNLVSPERQNVTAIKDAIEGKAEMEIGKSIEQKQDEVDLATEARDEQAQHPGAAQEVNAKPGTQIIINVGSKAAAIQKVSYVKHCPGHKNSKGEAAPWCVYSHETGKILSSHKSEAAAKKHLQDMHAHSGSAKKAADHVHTPHDPDTMMTVCEYCGIDMEYDEVADVWSCADGEAVSDEDLNRFASKSAGTTADWCDNCIFRLHPEILMSHAPGHGQVGKCQRCGNNSELRAVKVPMEKKSETVQAESIGGENQPGATAGNAGGMFGGTDLEGPDFKVGFTFRGTPREASFSTIKEAHAFIKSASAKFGKVAGDFTMKCPSCQGQATKDRHEDSYKCPDCGWNSHTAVAETQTTPKKASVKTAKTVKQVAPDPAWVEAMVNAVLVDHAARAMELDIPLMRVISIIKTKIKKVVRKGIATISVYIPENDTEYVMQLPAAETEHGNFKYNPGKDPATGLPKSGAADPAKRNLVLEILKQGPKTTGEIEKSLGGGKYTNISWPILQELLKEGILKHKQMRWELKTASRKVAFGKKALSISTRVNEGNKNDILKQVIEMLNATFAELKQKNPQGYMDSFEQQLPALCMDIAKDLGLQMEYLPEADEYIFFDQAASGTKGKSYEQLTTEPKNEPVGAEGGMSMASLKSATIRITSVRAMPRSGTPEAAELKIAIQTLKMPKAMADVMGGPGVDYAHKLLAQYGLRWDDAAYMAGGKGVKKAGEGMAKTIEVEAAAEKEAGFNFFFPGQVLQEFYPELQHEIVDYPNATNSPMGGAGNPEITGDGDHDIEGMLDDALGNHGIVEAIQLPADVGELEEVHVSADYSSTSPAGGMGIGRDGKPEVLEGAPLRKENDIRGQMFTDEFYGQYEGIPGAAMNIASKTAAEGDEAKQFGLFLKKVCGEIAATLVAAFKVTTRPLLDKVPGIGEMQLDVIEQGQQAMGLGTLTQGGRVKYLMDKLNDGDIKAAINDAWAQAAVWNDNAEGGFVYEVFVRPETIDTDSLKMKYKFVCGTRE